ncbi:MAG: hypothetical protein ACI4A5_04765, partial [Hominilimicola sp.]
EIKDYLRYYEKGQLTVQVKFIVDYYENYSGNTDREYQYTTPGEITNFAECAYELLHMILKQQKLI